MQTHDKPCEGNTKSSQGECTTKVAQGPQNLGVMGPAPWPWTRALLLNQLMPGAFCLLLPRGSCSLHETNRDFFCAGFDDLRININHISSKIGCRDFGGLKIMASIPVAAVGRAIPGPGPHCSGCRIHMKLLCLHQLCVKSNSITP